MSLKEYARKRHFEKTPEPPAIERATPTTDLHRFFVQRHHASHLHYDFRLEIDGTLKSWAIPKGPTLDPASKRFAAMVEDHPISYGDFEGNIPAGNYGAGSVMLWDRGTFELIGETPAADQIQRGDLKFRLKGEKLTGEFALVMMKGKSKGNEWLLLKKKGPEAQPGWDVEEHARSIKSGRTQEEIARNVEAPAAAGTVLDLERIPGAVAAAMPASVKAMSAVISAEPPNGPEWLLEIKWDGIRALCYWKEEELQIFTRNGNRCDRQYPELGAAAAQFHAHEAIFDGEIAVLNERGISEFALIQPRIMNTDAAAIARMARTRPVTLFLFDLLYLDGYDLRKCTLADRKRVLASIVEPNALVRLSEHFEGDPKEILAAARQQGLEGLVAKCATSTYQPRRSPDWQKLKLVLQQEFVIAGFSKGERDYFGALILGLYENGKLIHVGNVGTGFDRKLLAAIHEQLQSLVIARSPLTGKAIVPAAVTWVRPELVCQVKFSNWTQDNHIRAPVFLGLRPDVNPQDCVRETAGPVAVSETPAPDQHAPLLQADRDEVTVTVDGHRLKLTHLSKVFFPGEGHTKRDLLNYYDAVAEFLVPHLSGRPLSLKRYPGGIDKEFFFQKNSPASYPSWLTYETIDENRHVIAENRAALLFLTNQGCIDQNPWMSRVGSLEHPDWILIDLDPQDCEYSKIIEAALLVRKMLDTLELEGYPKTTGGRGMHIYIPVEPRYSYEDTKSFAEVLARIAASRRPDLFTTPRSVDKRQKNKVYFDYLQNGQGKTIAAPYVVRAHPGATVATPLAWREVKEGLLPSQFTIKNAVTRFEQAEDLFKRVLTKKQSLDEPLMHLEKLLKE